MTSILTIIVMCALCMHTHTYTCVSSRGACTCVHVCEYAWCLFGTWYSHNSEWWNIMWCSNYSPKGYIWTITWCIHHEHHVDYHVMCVWRCDDQWWNISWWSINSPKGYYWSSWYGDIIIITSIWCRLFDVGNMICTCWYPMIANDGTSFDVIWRSTWVYHVVRSLLWC